MSADNTLEVDELCKMMAENAKDRCEYFAPILKSNYMATIILENGCVDRTALEITEVGPGECPGEVACNIIQDQIGGPICGGMLRSVGDFSGTGKKQVEDAEKEAVSDAD